MKSANREIIISVLVIIILLIVVRVNAQQYEYKGVYPAQAIFTTLCENCYLELPSEFLETNLVLSVSTDKLKFLERALISSSRSVGWELKKIGNTWKAEPIQNEGQLVYISCLTNEPINIPKYLYSYSIKSDSIRCYKRDSTKLYQDSITKIENFRNDSLMKIRLPFRNYELRYYSFTKNFSDKMGVEFNGIIASGNLHNKFHVYDDWKLYATQTNDTAFTYKQVNVAFDSLLNVDWGTEEQTLKTSYITNNGVVNNDYEWRKYGLIINLSKDTSRIKMEYTFRDKEQNISVLQGSAVGGIQDTLVISGQYTTTRSVNVGIPILSSIPILKIFFSTEQILTDVKQFELYLVPTEKAVLNENGRIENDVVKSENGRTKETRD